MSDQEPQFDVHRINLDTMTVEYVGRIPKDDALKHPDGWVCVITPSGTWIRTNQSPVWQVLKGDPDPNMIAITKPATGGNDAKP